MTQFSHSLKTWRKARRLSQLDLAVEADVSSRHISFLETGRAKPSREMIGRLGETLELPLGIRNQLLSQAGFAPVYQTRSWDEEAMQPVKTALEYMLDNHDPYPALVLDRDWNIVRLNQCAKRLFGMLGVEEGGNMIDIALSDLLPSVVENWAEVASHTAQRLRTESAAYGGVPKLEKAAEKLSAYKEKHQQPQGPVTPVIYQMGEHRLSLFTSIAQFGTPEDLTLDALKIEFFFPADQATIKTLEALSSA